MSTCSGQDACDPRTPIWIPIPLENVRAYAQDKMRAIHARQSENSLRLKTYVQMPKTRCVQFTYTNLNTLSAYQRTCICPRQDACNSHTPIWIPFSLNNVRAYAQDKMRAIHTRQSEYPFRLKTYVHMPIDKMCVIHACQSENSLRLKTYVHMPRTRCVQPTHANLECQMHGSGHGGRPLSCIRETAALIDRVLTPILRGMPYRTPPCLLFLPFHLLLPPLPRRQVRVHVWADTRSLCLHSLCEHCGTNKSARAFA